MVYYYGEMMEYDEENALEQPTEDPISTLQNQIEELKKQLLEEKERNKELQLQNRKIEKIISSLKQENIDFKTKYDKT